MSEPEGFFTVEVGFDADTAEDFEKAMERIGAFAYQLNDQNGISGMVVSGERERDSFPAELEAADR